MATKRTVDESPVADQPPPKRPRSPLKLLPREPFDTTQITTWNLKSLDSAKEKKHGVGDHPLWLCRELLRPLLTCTRVQRRV